VKTSEIPEDLLLDYLVGTPEEQRNGGDIRNTELVFLGQIKKAVAQGQIKMIQDRMDGLCATTEMEFNGLKVDVQEAGRRLKVLRADLAAQEAELNTFVPADCPFEFNWGSRVHVSCLIFGGTVKYEKQAPYIDEATGEFARKKATEDWPIINGHAVDPNTVLWHDGTGLCQNQDQYVSGKKKGMGKFKKVDVPGEIKTKYQDFFYTFPRATEPKEAWATKNNDGYGAPIYSTSGEIIVELALRNIPFVKALRSKQKLDKEIGTYYAKQDAKGEWTGMLTCVQTRDHMIHHKLNHTSTVTSRLSSSDPNGQNLPRGDKSEVKAMFVSRFGDDGEMIEADYSQLEVVVQGVLTEDEQLCEDLRNKVDFHCKRVAAKLCSTRPEVTYEYALDWCKNEDHPDYKAGKKERTKCKIFSFQRAYGAGAATIAEETGMSLEETQALMQAEDAMYPGVVVFNAAVETSVIKSAEPFHALGDDGKWKTYRRGYWAAPTGTLYTWRSYDAPEYARKRGKLDTFNPPEMKNYPVQGTGGEFVQAMCGRLWRHFVSNDNYGGKAFLVNTVHDCVWTDTHKTVRDQVAADKKRIMESIPEFYNERYGMNITVPFPVEVEYGPNMNKLSHWH
jgi:DNA polymerase I-like protein with 3'-5' exonuclease and polymerase domains